jgi:hypothetical protein
MLLQFAQLLRPHARQPDTQLLQRFGLALARRARRSLVLPGVVGGGARRRVGGG